MQENKPLVEHFGVTYDHTDGLWSLDLTAFPEITGKGDVFNFQTGEWLWLQDSGIDVDQANKRVIFLQDALAVMNDLTHRRNGDTVEERTKER